MASHGLDIGTLSGRIELEDHLSSALTSINLKLDGLENKFGGVGRQVAATAAGFFTAQAAFNAVGKAVEFAADLMADFSVNGAAAADVAENFDALATQAGRLSETLLGELKAGTRETIDDLTLMKMVNQDLAAGLTLTDEQFRTLADGAFALAQATGEDVATALEKMNDAMLTGRTRSVEMLTGKIDLTKAEEKYALSLGTTAEYLTEEEKLQAKRIAILESVAAATARIGEQTVGLDEKVDQLRTRWTNYYTELSKAVATSPKVSAAFDAIQESIFEAFGGDSQSMIDKVVSLIEYGAEVAQEYGPKIVDAFVQVKDWVSSAWETIAGAVEDYGPIVISGLSEVRDFIVDVWNAVKMTWNALPSWFKESAKEALVAGAAFGVVSVGVKAMSGGLTDFISSSAKGFQELKYLKDGFEMVNHAIGSTRALMAVMDFSSLAQAGASVKLIGSSAMAAIGPLGQAALVAAAFMAAWEIGKMEVVSDFFQKLGLRAMGYTSAEADAMIATDKATRAMVDQSEAANQHNEVLDANKKMLEELEAQFKRVTESTTSNTEATGQNAAIQRQTAEEIKKHAAAMAEINSVGKDYKETLAGINSEILATVKAKIQAGVSEEALATAYKLTKGQMDAVKKALEEEKDALDKSVKAAKEKADALAELRGMADPWEKTLRGVSGVLIEQAKEYLKLGASLDTVGKALGLTDGQMKAIQKSMEEATAKAGGLGAALKQGVGGAVAELSAQVKTLSGDLISLEEFKKRQSSGGSTGVTRANLSENLKYWQVPEGIGIELAKKGFSFQEIIDSYKSGKFREWVPHGPRIPGFKEGGYGDFGSGTLVELHGKEIITPVEKLGKMGNVTVIQYINGTAADVAKQVSRELMTTLKRQKQFGAA